MSATNKTCLTPSLLTLLYLDPGRGVCVCVCACVCVCVCVCGCVCVCVGGGGHIKHLAMHNTGYVSDLK